jgi:hypothetical protein
MNKEVYMKKLGFIALGIFLISLFFSVASYSATLDQIAGTWVTWSDAKLKITGIGSFTDQNYSETTLDVVNTFVLTETSSTGTYYYTGIFTLIDGKKLDIQPDSDCRNELIRTWVDWAEEIARENGVLAENIIFEPESLTFSQPSINKRTLIPKKTTIKAKGWVSALIDGVPYTKRFTYTNKVSFIARQ